MMSTDPYEICAFVARYHEKNGYAPVRSMIVAGPVDQMVANGVLQLLPLHPGGPAIGVCLTEKGYRMAKARPRRR